MVRCASRQIFHGREIRRVPDAAGGMNFVLQLSHTDDDADGWTPQERAGYDGWGHDSGRQWRTGEMLEGEGFKTFRSTACGRGHLRHIGSSAARCHGRIGERLPPPGRSPHQEKPPRPDACSHGWRCRHETSRHATSADSFRRFRHAGSTFGPQAFTLHHRFYLHLDGRNRMWLSAEDGCEGTPSVAKKFMGLF